MDILVTDWMSSMGVAALKRFDHRRLITVRGNTVTIPDDYFAGDTFSNDFLSTLIKDSDRSNMLIQRFGRDIETIMKQNFADKQMKQHLKDYFNQKKVLDKYLEETDTEMHELAASIITEIELAFKNKEEQHLQQAHTLVEKFFTTEHVVAKFNLNYVRSVVLNRATFGQTSFLNSSLSHVKYDGVCAIFKKDYLDDITFEWALQNAVKARDEQALKQLFLDFIALKKSKVPMCDYTIAKAYMKAHRKEKFVIDKPNTIDWAWFDKLEHCVMFPNQWASVPYEEKIFMPLASTSINDRWDLQTSNVPHVSSLAKLLLFIAPLACTEYRLANEYMRAFFYIPGDFRRTVRENNLFRRSFQEGGNVGESLKDSVSIISSKENRRVRDTMLIEFYSDGAQTKKTILRYALIDPSIVPLFSGTSIPHVRWKNIHPYTYRNELISRILHNESIGDLLYTRFLETIKLPIAERHGDTLYESAKLLEFLSKRGDTSMGKQHLAPGSMVTDGKAIRKAYELKKSGKKLDGYIYSLLKAVQTRNRTQFMSIAFRLYLTSGVSVPETFGFISDDQLIPSKQFNSLGFSFISGLSATPFSPPKDTATSTDTVSTQETSDTSTTDTSLDA